MNSDRWLRITAAAGVLLLLLAIGALAAQRKTSREADRLRQQLQTLQSRAPARPQGPGPLGPPDGLMGPRSDVFISRVQVVPQRPTTAATTPSPAITGPFTVEAAVTNRSDRTLDQPVYGLLVSTSTKEPTQAPQVQQRQVRIPSLAPGDTTTVRIGPFEATGTDRRHELIVSTPPLDPARTAGTVVKVVPTVKPTTPAPAPTPAPRAPAPTPGARVHQPPAAPPGPPAAPPPATPPPAAPPTPPPATPPTQPPTGQPTPPAPTPPTPTPPETGQSTPGQPAPQPPQPSKPPQQQEENDGF